MAALREFQLFCGKISRNNKKKEWVWGYGQVARVVKSSPYL